MNRWTDVVGEAHVAAGRAEDAVDGLVPAWVVRPGSVAEVQACVAAAAECGAALVASGLGQHLTLGAPPARFEILLRLDRLAGVIEHRAADMTVTAQAGCPLGALAAVLASADQWLPLDPPRPEATAVGGLVAADLSGPLRASQGRARDLLIGITVVGADGRLVKGGGRVVKNVAGYDLPKLHVGGLGTVGVIVEATFKVRPRPEREEAVVIACPSLRAAADLALDVLDGDVAPFWLEVASPPELAESPGGVAALAVGVAGSPEEVAHGRTWSLGFAQDSRLHATAVAAGARLRARLADFAAQPAPAVLRAAMLPSDLGEFLERAIAEARTAGTALRTVAHAASGVARLAVAEPGAVVPLVRALRPGLEASGGSLVVERARRAVKAEVDVWGDPGPGLRLMQDLKAAFDPTGLFAPGRFVGGL